MSANRGTYDDAKIAAERAYRLSHAVNALRVVRETLCELEAPDRDTLLTLHRLLQRLESEAVRAEICAVVASERLAVEAYDKQKKGQYCYEYCEI